MQKILPSSFIFMIAAPFIGKIVIDGGWAFAFIHEERFALIWTPSLIVGVALYVVALFCVGRLLIARAWVKAAIMSVAIILAYNLPKLEFDPEYVLFKKNKPAYLAAIQSDPSPHPKFMSFKLREFPGFPSGGTFYDVVYDETQELGLPETSRSPNWLAHHGYTSANVKGRANPYATIGIRQLEDSFFLVIKNY